MILRQVQSTALLAIFLLSFTFFLLFRTEYFAVCSMKSPHPTVDGTLCSAHEQLTISMSLHADPDRIEEHFLINLI